MPRPASLHDQWPGEYRQQPEKFLAVSEDTLNKPQGDA